MERGLVLLDDTDAHRVLLREAAEHATGADADLLLLAVLDEDEYEEDRDTLDAIGAVENVDYDGDAVLEMAAKSLRDMANDVLPEYGVDFEVRTRLAEDSEVGTVVVETGDETNCDHAFIVGKNRSPTGKALFGDTAQKVALNVDGFVTLATT